jgi:hypothetical protein
MKDKIMIQLKKITSKDVLGSKITVGMKYLLGGVAWGHFVKSTSYGDSVGIEGEFVAVNPVTKEQYSAPVIYLPQDKAESLKNALDARQDASECIEIKVEISTVASDKSKTGYTWLVTGLKTEESMNAQAVMIASLTNASNLLEAPKGK